MGEESFLDKFYREKEESKKFIIEFVDYIIDSKIVDKKTIDNKKINNKKKQRYYKKINEITKSIEKKLIEGYNQNNLYEYKLNNGLSISKELVIDHKISKFFGYKNNIPAEVIAHISNLRYIPSIENSKKGIKNYIDDNNKWIIEEYINKI